MAKALNPFAPAWYVPRAELERPEGQRTRFKIRGLDGTEQGYLAPEIIFGEHNQMIGLTGKGLELALGYGLSDWDNFSNDSGEVAFSRANFRLISHELRVELGFKILLSGFVSTEEKKISSSP